MPTWYYFSHPSNLAFHDFTKNHKPEKNLRSLLGLGLKFIPTPSLTNSWSRLQQSSYDRPYTYDSTSLEPPPPPQRRDDHLRPQTLCPIQMDTPPPHWTIPPVALEERLSCFSGALNKLFKTPKGKTNLLPHQH